MKKIIIPHDVKMVLKKEQSFLNREGMTLFSAESITETLDIHRAEKAHLVVLQLKRSGLSSEQFCSTVRNDTDLSRVSIIILCANVQSEIDEASRCQANAVMTRPVNTTVLLGKWRELLSISARTSCRVLLTVAVDGTHNTVSFFCRSENISTTGMLIEADKTLTIGDRIVCSFFLPTGFRIQAPAEVVRSTTQARGFGAFHYGIKFNDLSQETKQALEAYIESKC